MARALLQLALRLGVAAGLIWLFVGPARLAEACRLLIACEPTPMIAAFLIALVGILVKTVKWQVFLGTQGVCVRYGKLFRFYMASCFFNVFLPSSVGGDFKRMFDVALDTPNRATAVGSILADRGTGMYCLVAYCLIVALLRWSKLGGLWVAGPIVLATAAITLGVPVGLWVFLRFGSRMAGGRLSGKVLHVLRSAAAQVTHPLGLVFGLTISVVFLLLVNAMVWYLAQALSIPLSWEAIYVSVPLVFALATLPITINGIGVREGAFIYFLGRYGIAAEAAVALSLGCLALLIALGLTGGVVFVASPSQFRKPHQAPVEPEIPTGGH